MSKKVLDARALVKHNGSLRATTQDDLSFHSNMLPRSSFLLFFFVSSL
jgi:hypothetical protein